MTAESERALASAAAWLRSQLERVSFGEVDIRLVLHAGRVARVEKTTVEKEQAAGVTARSESGRGEAGAHE